MEMILRVFEGCDDLFLLHKMTEVFPILIKHKHFILIEKKKLEEYDREEIEIERELIQVIKDEKRLKELDYGNKLAGNVQQEFKLDLKFMKKNNHKIGFIGAGYMGYGMAHNLLKKNYPLSVIAHKNREPIEKLIAQGAKESKLLKDIAANDVIGKIDFQAPDESTGTDAILVAAGIEAVSEGDFSSSSNATSLEFMTGASEAATAKVRITSAGHLMPTADDSYDLGGASNQWRNVYTLSLIHI